MFSYFLKSFALQVCFIVEMSNNEEYEARLLASEAKIKELRDSNRKISNAEELSLLEQEIHAAMDAHAGLLLERHVQSNLDSAEQSEEEKKRKTLSRPL